MQNYITRRMVWLAYLFVTLFNVSKSIRCDAHYYFKAPYEGIVYLELSTDTRR
jgi:hypothetical protein